MTAFFLVYLLAGVWHYQGPFTVSECEAKRLDVEKQKAPVAYCQLDTVPR